LGFEVGLCFYLRPRWTLLELAAQVFDATMRGGFGFECPVRR